MIESNVDGENVRIENVAKFSDKSIRHAFIRKVFLILTLQLIISALIIAPMVLHEPIRRTIQLNRSIFWATFIASFVIYVAIACFIELTRTWPINYIILLLLTISTSIWTGCICAFFDVQEIVLALGICIALCILLAMFAVQTTIDFTSYIGIILVFSLLLLVAAMLAIFFPSRMLLWMIVIGGILLISIHFITDIQLMIGGKHKYSLSPEDYVLAAILLYNDIINLFLYILYLIALLSRR